MATTTEIIKHIESHLKQRAEAFEKMKKLITPIMDQHETLHKVMQPAEKNQEILSEFIDSSLTIQENWKSAYGPIQIPNTTISGLEKIISQAEQFRLSIDNIICHFQKTNARISEVDCTSKFKSTFT